MRDQHNQNAGTLKYEAPEVLARSYQGGSCDVWSAGVSMFVMLTGEEPFSPSAETPQGMLEEIHKKREFLFSSLGCEVLSDNAKALLQALLTVEPCQRPTAAEALTYAWTEGADEVTSPCGVNEHQSIFDVREKEGVNHQ